MRLIPVLTAVAVSACAAVPTATTALAPPPGSVVHLKAPDGTEVGTARLQQTPNGLLIEIEVKGLTHGWHGLHIHEKADCTAPAFTSAGAHVHGGTAAREHGFMTASGGEPGDLPNLWVGADGTGKAEFFAPSLTLIGGPPRTPLWDQDGSAVVVHATRDDHYTQPIGNSGARVACGTMTR
jgi:Cu-Zn family superoxide dismutase